MVPEDVGFINLYWRQIAFGIGVMVVMIRDHFKTGQLNTKQKEIVQGLKELKVELGDKKDISSCMSSQQVIKDAHSQEILSFRRETAIQTENLREQIGTLSNEIRSFMDAHRQQDQTAMVVQQELLKVLRKE